MNKNPLLNQNYICPIGADGVHAEASTTMVMVGVDAEPLGETSMGRAPRNDMAAISNYAQPSGATL